MEETIHGTTMPVLELSLADGESIVSEAGEFSWMSDAVQMATNTGGGMGGKGIMGAVKRAVSGASFMMTTYTAQGGAGSAEDMDDYGGSLNGGQEMQGGDAFGDGGDPINRMGAFGGGGAGHAQGFFSAGQGTSLFGGGQGGQDGPPSDYGGGSGGGGP